MIKQDDIKEIKLPGKTAISTEELLDVFNEHFINIGPNLAETIFKMKMMVLFRTLLTNKILNFLFSQLVLQWFIILLIICRLQKQPVLIKYQPRCSVLSR